MDCFSECLCWGRPNRAGDGRANGSLRVASPIPCEFLCTRDQNYLTIRVREIYDVIQLHLN